MDIANATAAGPSRGLLDVIFGSGPGPDEIDADGQGFGNLMNLIKVLNGNKEAEIKVVDPSRTLGETMPGKSIADGGVVGMPGMMGATPNFAGDQLAEPAIPADLERQRAQRLAELGIPSAAPIAAPSAQPGIIKPEQINEVLKAKGLPPLEPQEMKLLKDVNGKLAQADGFETPPELAATGLASKAPVLPKAAPSGQPLDPQLQKAMAAKGVDPKKVKAAEASASGGAPEKILTTETYLQMHENALATGANPKAPVKEPAAKPPVADADASSAVAKPEAALTAGAVAATAEKSLGARKRDDGAPLAEGAKSPKTDGLAAAGFGGALAQKTEAMKHDVYLPGADKPEQRASVLLAEVGSGVMLHAHKGGGEMRLVIHPDDLGEVRLKVGTKNGKVEVQVTAENEEVAKMIRGGSKELEASLKDQNLSLAKFEVSVNDATSVASTDTKSSLGEQFLSQNQQQHTGGGGLTQGSLSDDGRNAKWASSDQGSHQGGGYNSRSEDNGRATAKAAPFVPKMTSRASSGSGRLDVVA
jgi:hypothetical protein